MDTLIALIAGTLGALAGIGAILLGLYLLMSLIVALKVALMGDEREP